MANLGLRARLTAADTRVGEAALLEFRLINESARNLVVLRWHTPLEGVAGKIFRVLDGEGNEVPYRGIMAKRGRPSRTDYLTLAAGTSVAIAVDLADSYELRDAGSYSVEFLSPETSQVLSEGQPLAKSPDELEPIHIPANTARLHVADPEVVTETGTPIRPDLLERGLSSTAGEVISTAPTAKSLTFDNCDATSETTVTDMDKSAAFNAGLAHDHLSGLDPTKAAGDALYKKWFGEYTASRFGAVLANFDKIAATLEGDDITYNCAGPACQSSYFAYVYAGGKLEVFLCPKFWSAGTTGVDTQWGTMVHEVSHEVAATDDHAYGQTACQALATNDPDKATDNADTYEYFVEDFVMSVSEGCNSFFSSIGSSGKAVAKQAQRLFKR